jgi:uracil-DNA glycosylase family 4
MELSLTPGKPTLGPIPNTLGFDKRPVAPEGSSDAWLYLVGEAPGGKEAELGRPFVGPAGEALRDMMHEAEIDFSRVRLANAIPFRPIERSTRDRLRNRRPTQMELHTYGQSVLSDVAKVKPAVIVALGKSAAMLFGVSTRLSRLGSTPSCSTAHRFTSLITRATFSGSAAKDLGSGSPRSGISIALGSKLKRGPTRMPDPRIPLDLRTTQRC